MFLSLLSEKKYSESIQFLKEKNEDLGIIISKFLEIDPNSRISIETAIFVSIAFGLKLPVSHLLSMIFTLTALKVLYELAVLPITVKVTCYLKKVENMDSYEKPSWHGVMGWSK